MDLFYTEEFMERKADNPPEQSEISAAKINL
jgi:hypothetical protein